MGKRGESGLSLVVGVNKEPGMSSHDVVNRCRNIFGEKRVGHAGTLDPLASGVLVVCVGPATRLGAYLAAERKRYLFTVRFGCETATDDAEGEVTRTSPVPAHLFDENYAASLLSGFVGVQEQVPPAYSAIKVNGQRAYAAARKGNQVDLEPREITVYSCDLLLIESAYDGLPVWHVLAEVSKGTYIRALARDIGRAAGCAAHVVELQRRSSGLLALDECVSLSALETLGQGAALDPVRILGFRHFFADDFAPRVRNGSPIDASSLQLFEPIAPHAHKEGCECMAALCPSSVPAAPGELLCAVAENRLAAIYRASSDGLQLHADCVFATSVARG